MICNVKRGPVPIVEEVQTPLFSSGPVPGTALRGFVRNREREHSDEAIDDALPMLDIQVYEHFGVATLVESVNPPFEIGTQDVVVVISR